MRGLKNTLWKTLAQRRKSKLHGLVFVCMDSLALPIKPFLSSLQSLKWSSDTNPHTYSHFLCC